MHDHLDRYASMEEYIDDKRNIYRGQDETNVTVAGDDEWGKSFHAESKGYPVVKSDKISIDSPLSEGQSGGWITPDGTGLAWFLHDYTRRRGDHQGHGEEIIELVPARLLTPGEHQRQNLLAAALAAYSLGVNAQTIREALAEYKGIEHRLEFFHTKAR